MIYTYKNKTPQIDTTAFIADYVTVVGDVTIKENASLWYGVQVRGDIASVFIGHNTNVQENTVIHVHHGHPTVIEDHITIGHKCIIHGCTVKKGSLIGMGTTILDGAVVGENCLIGAGSLIPQGKVIPDNSLAFGNPVKVIREVNAKDLAAMSKNIQDYLERTAEYLEIHRMKDKT